MTMALSYLFAAVNPKLVLTVTVGDKRGLRQRKSVRI